MIIRKYNIIGGWPLYVSIICDQDLSKLDKVVNEGVRKLYIPNKNISIQDTRDIAGYLSNLIVEFYNKIKENSVEGVAVTIYVDKLLVNSYYGDFMNHLACRMEHVALLNFMTQV